MRCPKSAGSSGPARVACLNILGGHLAEPTQDVEVVIEELLADPTFEYIHTCNVVSVVTCCS